jgi:hypothetical protein
MLTAQARTKANGVFMEILRERLHYVTPLLSSALTLIIRQCPNAASDSSVHSSAEGTGKRLPKTINALLGHYPRVHLLALKSAA